MKCRSVPDTKSSIETLQASSEALYELVKGLVEKSGIIKIDQALYKGHGPHGNTNAQAREKERSFLSDPRLQDLQQGQEAGKMFGSSDTAINDSALLAERFLMTFGELI